jgi:Holliday junction resolvase RusA-like endonuclease
MGSFFITGEPAPQGSKTGRVVNGRVVMWESSAKVKPWRAAVHATTAQEVQAKRWETITEPIELCLSFYLPRPKSVRREFPSVKPDLDKLIRSTCDGLKTGGLYADDALIIAITATKQYAPVGMQAGCQVLVVKEYV